MTTIYSIPNEFFKTEADVVAFNGFEIGEQIGKGGFAVVFKAKNTKTGQLVACKNVKVGECLIDILPPISFNFVHHARSQPGRRAGDEERAFHHGNGRQPVCGKAVYALSGQPETLHLHAAGGCRLLRQDAREGRSPEQN